MAQNNYLFVLVFNTDILAGMDEITTCQGPLSLETQSFDNNLGELKRNLYDIAQDMTSMQTKIDAMVAHVSLMRATHRQDSVCITPGPSEDTAHPNPSPMVDESLP